MNSSEKSYNKIKNRIIKEENDILMIIIIINNDVIKNFFDQFQILID